MTRKTSKIWTLNRDEFQQLIHDSISLADALRKLNINPTGNYKILKARIKQDNIDISHIKLGLDSNTGRTFQVAPKNKMPLAMVLSENSTYLGGGKGLKNHILNNSLLEEKCAKCGLGTNWNNERLVLQLDHINGTNTDNRLENLRFLCPNCHSQTDTFGGRNQKH